MYPERDPTFPRCKLQQGSYMHMFWECPITLTYWKAVFDEINLRLQLDLFPTPFLALLGIPDDDHRSHYSKLLITYLLYYTKKDFNEMIVPRPTHGIRLGVHGERMPCHCIR